MKLRIKFAKEGLMQYVGHLDLMRCFQKAIVRAKLPVAYSAGFHPHQILSFAAPLGIGLCSDAEYFDLELTEPVETDRVIVNLNAQMPEGLAVKDAVYLAEGAKNAMSLVAACDYVITADRSDFDYSVFAGWTALRTLLISKKTKKAERTIDILPMIYVFQPEENRIVTRLASGSAANLKPAEMMEALTKALGFDCGGEDFLYRRTEIYAKKEDGGFVPLGEATGGA